MTTARIRSIIVTIIRSFLYAIERLNYFYLMSVLVHVDDRLYFDSCLLRLLGVLKAKSEFTILINFISTYSLLNSSPTILIPFDCSSGLIFASISLENG